jgi:hypothetical protein
MRKHNAAFWSIPIAAFLTSACEPARIYHGKDICQLVSNQDIAAIFQAPFDKGERTGHLNFDENYIGSSCTYDSVDKWRRDQPKFRVLIAVEYATPEEMSLAKKRAAWEKERYQGTPFYTGIHEMSDVADIALAANDHNKAFDIWAILKPGTRVEVEVMGVMPEQAEPVARAVAQKAVAAVKAEHAPPPTPRQ